MQRTLRYPGFWLAVGLVAIVLLFQIILSTPLEVIDVVLRESKSAPLRLGRDPLVLGLINIVALGVAIGVGLLVNRVAPRRAFPFKPLTRTAWLALPIMALGTAVLLSEVDNIFRWVLPPPKWLAEMMGDIFLAKNRFGSLFFAMVIVAPLTEELLFRGVILRGLLGRFRPWVAVCLSAMLFSVMHFNPWQTIPPFFLGMIFGWFYLRTGSLWPCIAGHALNNFLFLIVTSAPFGWWEPLETDDMLVVQFQPWWLNLAGAGLLAVGLWLFRKGAPVMPPDPEDLLPPVIAMPVEPPVLRS